MKKQQIKNLWEECKQTVLEKTNNEYSLVAGIGNLESDIMVIGASPTAKEEATGNFLEGKPKKNFEDFLSKIDLSWSDFYSTYSVKIRPYKINERTGRKVHRDVVSDEIEMFAPYLAEEIHIIEPSVIILLGETAYNSINQSQRTFDSVIGKMIPMTVGEMIYDVLIVPHPKERSFSSTNIDQKAIDRLKAIKNRPIMIERDLNEEKVIDYSFLNVLDNKKKQTRTREVPTFEAIISDEPKITPVHREIESEELSVTQPTRNVRDEQSVVTQPTEDIRDEQSVVTQPVEKMVAVKPDYSRKSKNGMSGPKKVVVVYGGSELVDDPTYAVVERVSSVLKELSVSIRRIDLFKKSYSTSAFLSELENSDGVILATTIEWIGIGGLMQTFLDECYNTRQFQLFNGVPLFGIVVSRQTYERDAYLHMIKSWEILGGVEGSSIISSIASSADVETNRTLLESIDKKTEDYYRIINQNRTALPTSILENKIVLKIASTSNGEEDPLSVTNQKDHLGSEAKVYEDIDNPSIDNQNSFISNYDEFIEKQEKDIEDISSLFKERLTVKNEVTVKTFPEIFEYKYKPDRSFSDCVVSWVIIDRMSENFVLEFKGAKLKAKHTKRADGDVIINVSYDVIKQITEGKISVQRAFMTGEIKAKGNFTLLYKLDNLFAFASNKG